MYQTSMYVEYTVVEGIVPTLRAHTFPMGRSTCSQAPVTVRQVFRWREGFGAGDTEEGFRYMWRAQGRCPSRGEVRGTFGENMLCKGPGTRDPDAFGRRMDKGREENGVQDMESHGASSR